MTPLSRLWFWVLGSVLGYILGGNLLWWLRNRFPERPAFRCWLIEVGRFLFFLGVPYLALGGWPLPPLQGWLSPEDMGLVGLNARWPVARWLEAVGTGLGLGLIALPILALAWANACRWAGPSCLRFSPRPWWALLVDGFCLQIHWAFYRGALAVLLDNVYWGVFLGLALVYLEWGLNPRWRQGWRSPGEAGGRWLRAALALIAALLFLLTRNLWVCLALHWPLEQLFWHLGRTRAVEG